MTVGYSDTIYTDDESPVIIFTVFKKIYIGGKYEIFAGNDLILAGTVDKSIMHIKLDVNMPELFMVNVRLSNENVQFNFPVTLCRLRKDQDYIICDIDFTISATSFYHFITTNLLRMKTILHSSEILNKLSSDYRVIYLTGRSHILTRLTKQWLVNNNYPDGPLLSRWFESSIELLKFKIKAIAGITPISRNGIGIGDLRSDIKAYMHHKLKAIKIIHPVLFKRTDSYVKKGDNFYKVSTWKAIEKIFKDKIRK